MSPGEITLATEQLNTNEVGGGVGGVNGKKALVTDILANLFISSKKTICSPNIITPIID